MALSPLQERVAALIAGLPESERFVLAGGAALAAHGLLDRTTRDLDYFAAPEDVAAVRRLADAVEAAALAQGLTVTRERHGESFVRFSVSDAHDQCELDLAIDYRALEPVETSYGPAFDVRELGANKVLAIFDRAEPRDFIDLAQLTKRFPLEELIALADAKDRPRPRRPRRVPGPSPGLARSRIRARRPQLRAIARHGPQLAGAHPRPPQARTRRRSLPWKGAKNRGLER